MYERVIRQDDSDVFWANLIQAQVEKLKRRQRQSENNLADGVPSQLGPRNKVHLQPAAIADHDSKLTVTPVQSNPSFNRMVKASRIIREYSGALPCSQQAARHILRCEHLRPIPGEDLQPYRVEPQYTHQIWLWYRTQDQPNRMKLVFRGQFEFAIPGRSPDAIAQEVTKFLASYLMTVEDYQRVIRQDDSDLFWATLIYTKVESMKGKQGQILL